jgi:hypothetical protein
VDNVSNVHAFTQSSIIASSCLIVSRHKIEKL